MQDKTHSTARLDRIYSSERIETPDGWQLVAHRVRPTRGGEGTPVMLVHGHGTGAWTFLGGVGGGLAGALADAGRDVWAVELRGSTDTRHADEKSDVTISDKLGIDLKVLVDHLRRRTGSEQVDAVGHSMGGILLYLGAMSDPSWPIRRLVTVGSPLSLSRAAVPRPLRGLAARFLTRRVGRVRVSGLITRLSGRIAKTWMPAHFHPENVEERMFRAFLKSGVTDVFGGELNELLRWIDRSDHRELLPNGLELRARRLAVPTRFIVGSQDPLTTPEAVRHAWSSIGSPACEYLEVGRATGFARDYRHLDLLLGQMARKEIAPLVVDWLSRGFEEAALQAAV